MFLETTCLALARCDQSVQVDLLELGWVIGSRRDRAHLDYRRDHVGTVWYRAHCLPGVWNGDPWDDSAAECTTVLQPQPGISHIKWESEHM